MKKQIIAILILLIIGLFSQCAFAQSYNPIAVKAFGVDSATQLDKQVRIWQLLIDAKAEKITVFYDIVLVSNNIVVSIIKADTYIRDNSTSFKNFTSLRTSTLGQGISYLINQDVGRVQSLETIVNDLIQK